MQQGTFGFYGSLPHRPERPERLFFAILPEARIASRVGAFAEGFLRENQIQAAPLRTERLHVTLHHVRDYKRLATPTIYASWQVGSAVSMPPFEVAFRSVKSFEAVLPRPGRQPRWPLVLLGEGRGLLYLNETLRAAMRTNRLHPAEQFVPHMTLCYAEKPVRHQEFEPIHLLVRDFFLIHSRLGLTQYIMLGQWELRG